MKRMVGPMSPPPDPVWRAGNDRVGHAFPRSGRRPALCGAAYIEERLAWPVETRHDGCLSQVDRLTRAALRGPAAERLPL